MSTKIGEALVDRGVLTRHQLNTALHTQLMRGGHLGTNLIELGFTDEATLGQALGEVFDMRPARKEMFDSIPPAVLETIPREEAVRRRVVPLGLDGRCLQLAVIDRKHVSNLPKIAGRKIELYVAPEVRILEALEQYYDLPRPPRFLALSGSRTGNAGAPPPPIPKKTPAPWSLSRIGAPPKPAPRRQANQVPRRLKKLGRRLAWVRTHAELGEVLLDHAVEGCARRILFAVDRGKAQVVASRNVGLDVRTLQEVRLRVDRHSVFALAAEDSFYRGPVPVGSDGRTFFDRLGLDAPRELLLLLIHGEERLEAVLYGDGGPEGSIDAEDDAFPATLEMIETAVRMLDLRVQLNAG